MKIRLPHEKNYVVKFAFFLDATSDASDVEKRIQQLEEELLKRRRDLDRIRKRREKDQLRKQEQRLKQELQVCCLIVFCVHRLIFYKEPVCKKPTCRWRGKVDLWL